MMGSEFCLSGIEIRHVTDSRASRVKASSNKDKHFKMYAGTSTVDYSTFHVLLRVRTSPVHHPGHYAIDVQKYDNY